jgi:hypothetical protein
MDTLEELAQLYFRLNGFFTVPNYILHGPTGQKGEVDVLALRLAHKLEKVGGLPLRDDPKLELRPEGLEMILAEVKRTEGEFNKSWKQKSTMEYVLRFAGFFEDEECLAQVSSRLAQGETYEDKRIRIRRMLCTGAETIIEDADHRKLRGMLAFIVDRFGEHEDPKADHEQWTGTLADYIYALATGRERKRDIKLEELDRGYLEYRRRVLCR